LAGFSPEHIESALSAPIKSDTSCTIERADLPEDSPERLLFLLAHPSLKFTEELVCLL
jgi:hypothetical protein